VRLIWEGLAASPIFTFLKFQGGDQHGVDHFSPDIPQPWDGSPHPTPRSWEAACRAMLDDQLDDRLAALVLEGFVGEAAGRAAYAFIKLVGDLMPKLNADGSESKVCIDLDNCLKVALDALQGIAFDNDRQIRRIVATYGDAVAHGGMRVAIASMKD